MQWHNQTIGQKVVQALGKNGFAAEYADNCEQALAKVLALLPAGAKIGCGGSVTRSEIGLMPALQNGGYKLLDWNVPGMSAEDKAKARREALTADVFITGSNAVTLGGELVNIDGTGNRVASMAFGPGKTIIIAGINKVVPDLETAFKRIQMIAAPANNKRLDLPNPCTQTGICMDCSNPTRICNVTTIMHKRPSLSDITVIIVGEQLGY